MLRLARSHCAVPRSARRGRPGRPPARHTPPPLRNPEPDFFILGAKSYARYNNFLLQTGYAQAAEVLPLLAHSQPAAR